MNGVLRKTWPECVQRKCTVEVDDTAVRHEISNLGRKSNLEGMEETDINELLNSHNHEFSNEELLQLQLQIANKEDDSDSSIEISKYLTIPTAKGVLKCPRR